MTNLSNVSEHSKSTKLNSEDEVIKEGLYEIDSQTEERPTYELATVLSQLMCVIGFIMLIGGLIAGFILLSHKECGDYCSSYDGFFENHNYAIAGLSAISSAVTFGLPFAAIGAYMNARLKAIKD